MRTPEAIRTEIDAATVRLDNLRREWRQSVAERNRQILRLHQDGTPIKHIAADLGVTPTFVSCQALRMGSASRNKRRTKHEAIIAAWLAGEKSDVIALRLHTSRGQIIKVVRHYGLPKRSPGPRPKAQPAAQVSA